LPSSWSSLAGDTARGGRIRDMTEDMRSPFSGALALGMMGWGAGAGRDRLRLSPGTSTSLLDRARPVAGVQ